MLSLIDMPWSRPRVAVLEISGAIGMQVRAQDMVRTIKSLREDPRVRAVVVEIESGGGAAPASDAIYRALKRLSEKKPTLAYVGAGALSGGYLIACAAREIHALPTALVGSIGVIFTRPVVQELMQKLGVKMVVHQEGKLKAMFQPWRDPTPEEDAKVRQLADAYYEWFVDTVAAARRLPQETVRQYATGEMFTARQAKEIGLVDELGDFDSVVERAKEQAKTVEPPRLTWVRPRRPLLERLLARGVSTMADQVIARIEERLYPPRFDLR